MSDFTSDPVMPQRRRSRPGEWWFAGSLLFAIAAPALIAITLELREKVALLQKEGVVCDAVLTGKRTGERTYTSTKGRTRTTTSYLLDLSYDALSKNRFAEWNNGRSYLPSVTPARATKEIEVSKADFEPMQVGAQTLLVVTPYPSNIAMLASEARDLASGVQIIVQWCLAALCLLLAVWCSWRGWRARGTAAQAG
jgi:hypothetical protein